MSECEKLLCRIRQLKFAIVETAMYLDSHPDSAEALKYYNDRRAEYKRLVASYEENCGPLSIYGGSCGCSWQWVASPWPWETGDMTNVDV